MAEVVAKVGVRKAAGYLYFVDKRGNVARAKMSRAGRKKGKAKVEVVAKAGVKKQKGFLYFIDKKGKEKVEVVAKAGVKKQKGFLYFIDGKGNVARAKMARGRKGKKRR